MGKKKLISDEQVLEHFEAYATAVRDAAGGLYEEYFAEMFG